MDERDVEELVFSDEAERPEKTPLLKKLAIAYAAIFGGFLLLCFLVILVMAPDVLTDPDVLAASGAAALGGLGTIIFALRRAQER